MDETYRLVFRGEILEGQHKAVVKRRLTELLKLDDAGLEKLFSGEPVVLKRSVDRQTAARYQALFKQAGGRLRVQAEDSGSGAHAAVSQSLSGASQAAAVRPPIEQGRPAANTGIEAPDFSVQTAYFPPPAEPRQEIQAPDYAVAEVGAVMSEGVSTPQPVVIEVNFDVAEVGADLLEEPVEVVVADIGPLDFELADVGADIGPGPRPVTASAPDVSHLALVEA